MDNLKVCVLSANLGNFDTPIEHVKQDMEVDFHTFTDEDFPPIADLPPRFQYRIPKLFGWQMKPGYDIYIWLDGSMQLTRPDSVKWLIEQLGDSVAAFFKHPYRNTVQEEVDHIEDHLQKGKPYITSRYKNGLHKETLNEGYNPGTRPLLASTVFIYKTSPYGGAQGFLREWWALQSRYYSCDQIALSILAGHWKIATINANPFKNDYLIVGSKHI